MKKNPISELDYSGEGKSKDTSLIKITRKVDCDDSGKITSTTEITTPDKSSEIATNLINELSKTDIRVIKAYRSSRKTSMESYIMEPGAQKIIDDLNSNMYSSDPLKLANDLKSLKENYPDSYGKIKKYNPELIINVQRYIFRDETIKNKEDSSGKIST